VGLTEGLRETEETFGRGGCNVLAGLVPLSPGGRGVRGEGLNDGVHPCCFEIKNAIMKYWKFKLAGNLFGAF